MFRVEMRLVLARTFVDRHFDPVDAPDLRTVRTWVRSGMIDGKEIGKRVYVDEDAFVEKTGNGLADRILCTPSAHQDTKQTSREA